MTETLTVLLAAGGPVAAILTAMLPVLLQQGRSLRREIILQSTNLGAAVAGLRADLAEMSTGSRADLAAAVTDLRADLAEMRRDLTARLDSLTVRGGSAKTRHVSAAVPEVDQPVGNGDGGTD